ncbi:transcriptional regulator, TetR family [Micromonospora halophytica]|uniref:Transcriptional regulator, TetR family n=2 Tax=Micromonospora halophytica TaxID=47864 RepID=A0A1C5IJ73_9ACTN|nr:transcriptional regulator, TetR family [Micromonospora halophytica]
MFMTQMTKDDWFRVASRQLVEHGEQGLTLAALTSAAGVTQGSFYHHFGGQAGFVEAFLAHLAARAFIDVSAAADEDSTTPAGARRALRRLVEIIAAEDLELEAAVRRWSQSNARVAEVVAEIDSRRGELLGRLFLVATGDPSRAAHLTRLNGTFYLGAVHSRPVVQGEEYARMARDLERLIEPPEATP